MYKEWEDARNTARATLVLRVREQIEAQAAAGGPTADRYEIALAICGIEEARVVAALQELRTEFADSQAVIEALWHEDAGVPTSDRTSLVGRVVEVSRPSVSGDSRAIVVGIDEDVAGAVRLDRPIAGCKWWHAEELTLLPKETKIDDA